MGNEAMRQAQCPDWYPCWGCSCWEECQSTPKKVPRRWKALHPSNRPHSQVQVGTGYKRPRISKSHWNSSYSKLNKVEVPGLCWLKEGREGSCGSLLIYLTLGLLFDTTTQTWLDSAFVKHQNQRLILKSLTLISCPFGTSYLTGTKLLLLIYFWN